MTGRRASPTSRPASSARAIRGVPAEYEGGASVLPGSTISLPGWFRISLTGSDAMVEASIERLGAPEVAPGAFQTVRQVIAVGRTDDQQVHVRVTSHLAASVRAEDQGPIDPRQSFAAPGNRPVHPLVNGPPAQLPPSGAARAPGRPTPRSRRTRAPEPRSRAGRRTSRSVSSGPRPVRQPPDGQRRAIALPWRSRAPRHDGRPRHRSPR